MIEVWPQMNLKLQLYTHNLPYERVVAQIVLFYVVLALFKRKKLHNIPWTCDNKCLGYQRFDKCIWQVVLLGGGLVGQMKNQKKKKLSITQLEWKMLCL